MSKTNNWAGRKAGYNDFGRRRKVHANIKLLLHDYILDFDDKIIAEYPPALIDEVNLHYKNKARRFEMDLWLDRTTGAFRYLIVKIGFNVWSTNIVKKGDKHVSLNMLPNGIWLQGVFCWTKNYKKLRFPVKFKLILMMKNPKQVLETEPKDVQTRLM